MNFIHIWAGVLPTDYSARIEALTAVLSSEDTYTLVTDQPPPHGVKTADLELIEAAAIEVVESKEWWGRFSARRIQYRADFIRFYMASIDPDMFYLDMDVELLGRFQPKGQGPFFGAMQHGRSVGNHVFYVGGNTKWFKNLLSYLPANFDPARFSMPMWMMQQRGVGVIPPHVFIHDLWDDIHPDPRKRKHKKRQ